MRRQLRLRPAICFMIGVVGAVMNLLAGALMVAGVGEALYAQTAGFVLYGAMLLLLAVTEKGNEGKTRRIKLLLIFVLLMLGMLRLPLLDVVEAAALPLAALMYRRRGDGPFIIVLAVFETGFATLRTLALVPRLVGGNALLAMGIGYLAVGLVRGCVLLRLFLGARRAAPAQQAPRSPLL